MQIIPNKVLEVYCRAFGIGDFNRTQCVSNNRSVVIRNEEVEATKTVMVSQPSSETPCEHHKVISKTLHERKKITPEYVLNKVKERSDFLNESYCHTVGMKLFRLLTGKDNYECVGEVYVPDEKVMVASLLKPGSVTLCHLASGDAHAIAHSFIIESHSEGARVHQACHRVYSYEDWISGKTKTGCEFKLFSNEQFNDGFVNGLKELMYLLQDDENQLKVAKLSEKLFGSNCFPLKKQYGDVQLITVSSPLVY